MKVAMYRSGEEIFSLRFEETQIDKLNFWRQRNLKNFTAPDQWSTRPSHLDLNLTPGYCYRKHNFTDE